MGYTGYELLWLFFIYSFLGWIVETVAAAIKHKHFANRGLIDLPFCIWYGIGAVFISIFGRELTGGWLYIGSVVLITVFMWLSGHLIEKIYHEKWWQFPNKRWNIDGYASLPVAAVLGVAAVVIMKWGNGLLLQLFHIIPQSIGKITVWVLVILCLLDMIATLIAIYGKNQQNKGWEVLERSFKKISSLLSSKIYFHIEKRIRKAYPTAEKVEVPQEKAPVFASGCGFYKLIWLFMIGAFLGDLTETIFCRITGGVWMSRSSVVWGPFSIVWGLAIAIATLLLYNHRKRRDSAIFLAGVVLGGAYEYICSVFTEIVFGKVFWDYSKIPFNLGGRINLLYCFFWGIAAVVWIKGIYPYLSAWIEKIPIKAGKVITWVMVIFMCCNMLVSSMALIRSNQRAENIPAEQKWQIIMDERFDDERLQKIYPNALDAN